MEKRFTLFPAFIAAGTLTALFTINVPGAQITEEKAKSIALEHAGVKSEDVSYIYSESEDEKGQAVYHVEFMTKTYDAYDYEILVSSGTVLAVDYDKKSPPADSNNQNKEITLEQARELALKNADLKSDQVTFLKEKTDWDDGLLIYEIEFYTDAYQKYDYDIDAKTGEILAWDFDADSTYARQDSVLRNTQKNSRSSADKKQTRTAGTPLSAEDAKAAALKEANLNNSQVTWGTVCKEHDDGRLIFKGEFYSGSLEYEFEMDAADGRILDWDVESIYD